MFTFVALSFLIELLLFVPFIWKLRRFYVWFVMLTVVVSMGWILYLHPWLGVIYSFIGLFRLLNLARVVKARMHPLYLYYVVRRSSLTLMVITLLSTETVYLIRDTKLNTYWWPLLAVLQAIVAAGLLISVSYNLAKARFKQQDKHYSDDELPTLTVAIPARNETTDLETCLKSLVASDYPKLEIVVLDDCSQDKTAEIIKSFAQDGVRFVQGQAPQQRWLAKNQAYQSLYEESSGDLMLFCGVDTRFTPETLRALVTHLMINKLSMVSVLPRRLSSNMSSAFIQPMRYWWELAPLRSLTNRPAVLSTCWLIKRDSLKKHGAFKAVCHAILPEGYFARSLQKDKAYEFVLASDSLNVQTIKSAYEQKETALRTQYPKIRRRPEIAMLLTVFNLVFLLGPFVLLVSTLILGYFMLAGLAGLACLLLIVSHVQILMATDAANVHLGFISYPIAVFAETYYGYASMLCYEFGTIEWKGRNICIPVMHVIPKLPKLPD